MHGSLLLQVGAAETLTWFVAHALLIFACLGAALYARANERYSRYDPLLWRYIALSCFVGAAYAAVAIVETAGVAVVVGIAAEPVGAVRRLAQLFFIMFLALAMRELYYQTPHRSGDETTISLAVIRRIETVFLVVIFVQFLVVILFGLIVVSQIVHLFGSLAFTVYGVSFAQGIRWGAMTRGTVLEWVATYVSAVLLTLGVASAVVVVDVFGVALPVVESTVNVLTVMGASFLIVLVIRLKQNVDAAVGG